MRKNAILLSISEGVTLLVADSKAEQSRWHAALNGSSIGTSEISTVV